MLVCNCCGKTVEEQDIKTYRQCHAYSSLGDHFTEEIMNTRCACGGEFVKARECKVCGCWYPQEDSVEVCESCMESYETVGEALKLGEQRMTNVEVNEFIAFVLPKEQIDRILTKWVEENFVDHSKAVVEYCESDKSWFADYIIEKHEEEKDRL